MVTFTQRTKQLRDLQQEIKLRLSYTHFFMAPETRKLVLSPEDQQEMVEDLRRNFLQTHQLLQTYETELEQLLTEVISQGWTEENSGLDRPTLP